MIRMRLYRVNMTCIEGNGCGVKGDAGSKMVN